MPKPYRRKTIELLVCFTLEPTQVHTLEGVVACQAGDAIVTGTRGEQWPVPRQRFEATYGCASPLLAMGQNGLYRRKPYTVLARQLDEASTVTLSGARGTLSGQAKNWLLQGPEGDQWLVANEIFQATYEPES